MPRDAGVRALGATTATAGTGPRLAMQQGELEGAAAMKSHPRRKVLVLLDGPEIRREAVRYAVELAQRTESGVFLLMLLRRGERGVRRRAREDGAEGGRLHRAAHGAMVRCVEETRARGVQAEGAVRVGDPASELLKFLAAFRPCQAVVWGGNETFLRGTGRTPVRGHWLERVRDELDCTLVVPSWKRKRTGDDGADREDGA